MASQDGTGADALTRESPRSRVLPGERSGERTPMHGWLVRAGQVFGLCGFALAQPLLDLLGNNPTFFVAHDAGRTRILIFTLVVILVPPTLIVAALGVIRLASKALERLAMALVVGGLGALTIVPAINRAAGLSTAAFVTLGVAATVAFTLAYLRYRGIETFATYLSPAPLFFAAVFLVASPASTLVTESDAEAVAGLGGTKTPVVMVILDELPLGGLLDGKGKVDATRFPGFARLAEISTWYPRATTVAPWTHLAVPALLTSQLPNESQTVPVAAVYPRSLFTMLGGSHNLHVTETVTRLCPEALCGASAAGPDESASLAKDSAIVLAHQLLPNGLAEQWLPPISGQWGGFGASGGAGIGYETAATDGKDVNFTDWKSAIAGDGKRDDRVQFAQFLTSIQGPPGGDLWYLHQNLPHFPYEYLPDGTRYNGFSLSESLADWTNWGADDAGIVTMRQRFLLQLRYADRQMGELVKRLETQGLLDEAMVIVTSDHGISFQAAGSRRATDTLDRTNVDEVLPVPLFVKYPGQSAGAVDSRPAQLVDVLPTVADALGIDLPRDWKFDGGSLKGDRRTTRERYWWTGSRGTQRIRRDVDPNGMARSLRRLVGPGGNDHDLYRIGPHGDLVGQPISGQRLLDAAAASVSPADSGAYREVDPTSGFVPALYEARLSGIESGSWLAVALNGTVAGVAPAFVGRDEQTHIEAMLDPTLFEKGANEVTVWLVGDDGSLRSLRTDK